jgi:hypothetical protein
MGDEVDQRVSGGSLQPGATGAVPAAIVALPLHAPVPIPQAPVAATVTPTPAVRGRRVRDKRLEIPIRLAPNGRSLEAACVEQASRKERRVNELYYAVLAEEAARVQARGTRGEVTLIESQMWALRWCYLVAFAYEPPLAAKLVLFAVDRAVLAAQGLTPTAVGGEAGQGNTIGPLLRAAVARAAGGRGLV